MNTSKNLVRLVEEWSNLKFTTVPTIVSVDAQQMQRVIGISPHKTKQLEAETRYVLQSHADIAAAAFVDKENKIFVRKHADEQELRASLVHEYTHALVAQSQSAFHHYSRTYSLEMSAITRSKSRDLSDATRPTQEFWVRRILDEGIAINSESIVGNDIKPAKLRDIIDSANQIITSLEYFFQVYAKEEIFPEERDLFHLHTVLIDIYAHHLGAEYVRNKLQTRSAQELVPALLAEPPTLKEIYMTLTANAQQKHVTKKS